MKLSPAIIPFIRPGTRIISGRNASQSSADIYLRARADSEGLQPIDEDEDDGGEYLDDDTANTAAERGILAVHLAVGNFTRKHRADLFSAHGKGNSRPAFLFAGGRSRPKISSRAEICVYDILFLFG